MAAVSIKEEQGNIVFTLPKELLSESFVQGFMERLRFLELIQKSELTEDKAWELSETIKTVWWEHNKERILQKISKG